MKVQRAISVDRNEDGLFLCILWHVNGFPDGPLSIDRVSEAKTYKQAVSIIQTNCLILHDEIFAVVYQFGERLHKKVRVDKDLWRTMQALQAEADALEKNFAITGGSL